ncbi:MAG: MTH938/NDUFAF3 family protein [Egibacteraceae bacterium]
MTETAPTITALSWGSITTDVGVFRDAKLWPGGGRGWDWNETGTGHEPGVQPTDVAELLDHGARTVILGCGQQHRLQVRSETLAAIADAGAAHETLGTHEAVERYNALAAQGEPVGALIHSTC